MNKNRRSGKNLYLWGNNDDESTEKELKNQEGRKKILDHPLNFLNNQIPLDAFSFGFLTNNKNIFYTCILLLLIQQNTSGDVAHSKKKDGKFFQHFSNFQESILGQF